MPSPIIITLPLTPRDYRAYSAAAKLLTRIMGEKAPKVETILKLQLGGRDARGLADDYLDAIRWPTQQGRVVSIEPPRRTTHPTKPYK